jgi:hypothetical protein
LIKLWDELLNVAWICLARNPFFVYPFEKSIRVIKLACLELDHPLRVLPHKETNDIAWTRVVRTVQVPLLLWELVIPGFKVI